MVSSGNEEEDRVVIGDGGGYGNKTLSETFISASPDVAMMEGEQSNASGIDNGNIDTVSTPPPPPPRRREVKNPGTASRPRPVSCPDFDLEMSLGNLVKATALLVGADPSFAVDGREGDGGIGESERESRVVK
ncbi:hypothetical protein HDU76_008343 [Blyttiomyces sp. JEL0837]|nr:hypothetical protein HDU76_008343 [Blyttiomyces sp. JEL0837]